MNLPNQFFGIFPAGELDTDGSSMPWRDEIDTKLLRLPPLFWRSYTYCEAAFLHRDSGAMFVTDAAVFVSERPPEAVPRETLRDLGAEDGFTISLLRLGNYRGGRDLPGAGGDRTNAPELCERIGWNRTALIFALHAPDARNILGGRSCSLAGLAGKFVVSPIVFMVVFQHHRGVVSEWANAIVADWGDDIEHVVSAHFPAFSAEPGERGIAARKFAEACSSGGDERREAQRVRGHERPQESGAGRAGVAVSKGGAALKARRGGVEASGIRRLADPNTRMKKNKET